ncbi:uncharacterized protein [Rutidosis leptorrhynchoides]|uniref:uncharacterized protein n=1 Tax=Rutidosis leptorrhynchoides TaxID=125765 RepID=UPI003A99B442
MNSFMSSFKNAVTGEDDKIANTDQSSNSDLMSSAKLVSEAAQSAASGQSDQIDKPKVAGAAGDLLDVAETYGKFDETKGVGQYIKHADDYLHEYEKSGSGETDAPLGYAPPLVAKEEGAPSPMNEEETPAPVYEEETPTPLNEDETPAPVYEKETPTPLKEDETPAPVYEEETPASLNEEETPASLNEEETPGRLNEEEALAPVGEKNEEYGSGIGSADAFKAAGSYFK